MCDAIRNDGTNIRLAVGREGNSSIYSFCALHTISVDGFVTIWGSNSSVAQSASCRIFIGICAVTDYEGSHREIITATPSGGVIIIFVRTFIGGSQRNGAICNGGNTTTSYNSLTRTDNSRFFNVQCAGDIDHDGTGISIVFVATSCRKSRIFDFNFNIITVDRSAVFDACICANCISSCGNIGANNSCRSCITGREYSRTVCDHGHIIQSDIGIFVSRKNSDSSVCIFIGLDSAIFYSERLSPRNTDSTTSSDT